MRQCCILPLCCLALFLNSLLVSGQASGPSPGGTAVYVPVPELYKEQQQIRDSLIIWQEKVQLHTNKDVYLPEEQLFFRANVLTGPQQLRVSANEVLKVELLDQTGRLLVSQFHRIDNGISEGSLQIPKKTEHGLYFLRAYTRWMLNYSSDLLTTKELLIKDKKYKPNWNEGVIGIFPEGGYLVNNLSANVVVQSTEVDLNQLPIVNSEGKVLARIQGYGNRVGTFVFTPSAQSDYFIQIDKDHKIPLPEVRESGYTLQVNNLDTENAVIRITATPNSLNREVYLRGYSQGYTFFEMKIDFRDAEVAQIEIPKSELPQRILQLSLEDKSGQLWASRSLSNTRNTLQIGVERQTDSTGAEFIKLKVIDKEEVPIQTELSVSLIKAGKTSLINPIVKVDKTSFDIARSLRFLEDLLVLTGQFDEDRRYNIRPELPEEIRYDFQKGLEFYGQAYDLNNKLLENTEIQILVTNEEKVRALKAVTDSGGMFTLSGLQIYGEAIMVFRTAGEETGEKLVKVVPYEYEIPPLSSNKKLLQDHSNHTSIEFDKPEGPQDIFNSDMTSKKLIALEKVTLVATRELHNTSPDRYDLRATRVIEQNIERPRTIPQLFLNIPGVQVIGLGTLSPQISIPRAAALGPILWVIDGFPLDQSTRLVDIINLVSYTDIKRIEILIGAEASVYGARSAGGVIQIQTRTGSDLEYLARKDAQVVFQGYHNSVLFEDYVKPVERKRMPEDMPVSVLWNPRLRTDQKGETILSLPSTMKDTPLMIEVRAVTEEGKRGELVTFFK